MTVTCHMVRPPSSGKTTFPQHLRQILPEATLLSVDAIRAECFGDEAIQGPWAEVESLLQTSREQMLSYV